MTEHIEDGSIQFVDEINNISYVYKKPTDEQLKHYADKMFPDADEKDKISQT
jgi:hypothetical protein